MVRVNACRYPGATADWGLLCVLDYLSISPALSSQPTARLTHTFTDYSR
jgi:hypothetical protein